MYVFIHLYVALHLRGSEAGENDFEFFPESHSYQTGRCFTRAPYLHIYTSISVGSVYRRTEAIFKYPMMLLSFSVIGYSFCSG